MSLNGENGIENNDEHGRYVSRGDRIVQRAQQALLHLPNQIGALLGSEDISGQQFEEMSVHAGRIRSEMLNAKAAYINALGEAQSAGDHEAALVLYARIEGVQEMYDHFLRIWDDVFLAAANRGITGPSDILIEVQDKAKFIRDSMPIVRRQVSVLQASIVHPGMADVDSGILTASLTFQYNQCATALRLAEMAHRAAPEATNIQTKAEDLIADLFILRQEIEALAATARRERLIP